MKLVYKLMLALCLIAAPIHSDDDDDWLDDLDFESSEPEIDPRNVPYKASTPLSEADQAAFLASTFISGPLWNQTYAPRDVNVIHFVPHQSRQVIPNDFRFHLFYNETDRVNVTIGDAFSLQFASDAQETTFFNLLATFLLGAVGADKASDLAMLGNLFKEISVTERKLGGLLSGGFTFGDLFFTTESSVLLSERNLATSKENEEAIRDIIAEVFGESNTAIDLKGEFARIRLGIGDTRLSLGARAINRGSLKSSIGISAILPTGTGVLLDGHFNTPRETDFTDFGIPLMEVRDILLNPRLGGKNYGLGLFANFNVSLFRDKFNLWSSILYDDFIPSSEKRLIMFKKTIEAPELAADVDLLEDFKRQYIAPTSFETTVNPGSVFKYTVFGDWKFDNGWSTGLGYNFYTRQREEIEKIKRASNNDDIGSDISLVDLNVANAEDDQASQHKFLAELNYNIKLSHSNLSIGLGGDYTLVRDNIGRDWTIYARSVWRF